MHSCILTKTIEQLTIFLLELDSLLYSIKCLFLKTLGGCLDFMFFGAIYAERLVFNFTNCSV